MDTNPNQGLDQTEVCKQEVMGRLGINITPLLQRLNDQRLNEPPPQETYPSRQRREFCERIVCRSLLGYTRAQIVKMEGDYNFNAVVGTLTDTYHRLSSLLNVDRDEIAGNWARIIYHLLNPQNGFRLEPLPMPNVNTLMSFGNHILLRRSNPDVSMFQQKEAQSYSLGAYFSAFESFMESWNRDRENPELLTYINNCLIEEYKRILAQNGIKIYTIAVVVPIHHNMGEVATQLLYGVAQMQLEINLRVLDNLKISDITDCCNRLRQSFHININDYSRPDSNGRPVNDGRMVLRVLIVNENNDLVSQGGGTFNQVAIDLAQVVNELEIMAVIGHYASEMTKQALGVYDDQQLLLVCLSSTSDELSNVVGMNSFFRMTTPEKIATQRLVSYLLAISSLPSNNQKVTIIYNKHSSYCKSFKKAIIQYIKKYPEKFYLLPECGELYDDYLRCLEHLESIQDQVSTIIIILDGGIEPNTLNTAGIISRLRMNQCLIVGSATFYHDNVLQWTEENISRGLLDINNAGNLVAYVPWHWHSQCNSDNDVATNFCRLGAALWGEGRLTWRSATAYDSVLMVVRALQSYAPQDHRDLRRRINQYFRHDSGFESGVTGRIKFDSNGDRLEPPTEMVAVRWDSQTGRCKWLPA